MAAGADIQIAGLIPGGTGITELTGDVVTTQIGRAHV